MSKPPKVAIALAAIVLLAGVGVWYFVLRDTSEPPADLSALDDELATDGTQASRSGLDGDWRVVPTEDAFVGYRIDELYGPGATLKTTVTGRTGDVTGSFTVDGTSITAASFEVDVTTLESDRSRRDETLRIRGLETDAFPTATFVLSDAIELGELPAAGEEIGVTATGDLTLHGETRSIELELTAKWDGERVSVDGSAPIVLADYDIEAIEIPQFVEVDDRGTLELVLLLERAA